MLCDHYGDNLIDIDRNGERLTGCVACNCWRSDKSAFIVGVSVEDIQALRGLNEIE